MASVSPQAAKELADATIHITMDIDHDGGGNMQEYFRVQWIERKFIRREPPSLELSIMVVQKR